MASPHTMGEKNNQSNTVQSIQKLKNHNVDLVINYSGSSNNNNMLNL